MADIRRIVDLYELYGSYKKVARELGISLNTTKKYLRRVKDLLEGAVEEILPKDRKIIQLVRGAFSRAGSSIRKQQKTAYGSSEKLWADLAG